MAQSLKKVDSNIFGQMIVSIDGICLKIFGSTFLSFEHTYKA
jgi:hypothetical protein